MTNTRQVFYNYKDIIVEVKDYINKDFEYDVITIVGEGEPTLYEDLGLLIKELKIITNKPIVVITNGALLYDSYVRSELQKADIIMPTLDCYDNKSFKALNRPYGDLSFEKVYNGLVEFSKNYEGSIWLETMLVKGYNDSEGSLIKIKELADKIKYDKLYINTPVRPPTEEEAISVNDETLLLASNILNGVCINKLISDGFYSNIKDNLQAVISIIKRHPMNQYEIGAFIEQRNGNKTFILEQLNSNKNVRVINYKGYNTYRYKKETQ